MFGQTAVFTGVPCSVKLLCLLGYRVRSNCRVYWGTVFSQTTVFTGVPCSVKLSCVYWGTVLGQTAVFTGVPCSVKLSCVYWGYRVRSNCRVYWGTVFGAGVEQGTDHTAAAARAVIGDSDLQG